MVSLHVDSLFKLKILTEAGGSYEKYMYAIDLKMEIDQLQKRI